MAGRMGWSREYGSTEEGSKKNLAGKAIKGGTSGNLCAAWWRFC